MRYAVPLKHKLKNLFTTLFLILFGLLTPLFLLEIGVRILGLAPPATPNPSIWEPHPLLGWWHRPHSGGMFYSDYNEFSAEVRINARGLRDREIGYDNPTAALRILSLADSFGEALQVELADTYHKQLETQLMASLDRPVEVLNAGVGGWGTDQEAIFYVAEGFRYNPDVVLLSFFVRNDVVNSYGPLEIRRNGGRQQKQFFSLTPTGALIAPSSDNDSAENIIHEESKSAELSTPPVDKTRPLLNFADGLWQYSALYRFMVPYLRDIPSVVQQLGPSGILGGEGVIRANHPTIPIPFFIYQTPPNAEFEAAWQLTEAIIKQLRDEVEQRGATLAVVIISAPEQLHATEWEAMLSRNPAMQTDQWDLTYPNQRLSDFLTAEAIPHLDLLPHFQQAIAHNPTTPLHFRHDQHWTPAGHALAAQTIHQFLLTEVLP